jgi:23S rRNA A2030 N6-methylase RlmJ
MSDEKRDVRAVVRTYKEDGKDKNVYQTVGTAWVSPHESTITVQLETLPINKDWNGKLYINKPYEKKEDYSKDVETLKNIKDVILTDEDMKKPIDISAVPF